MIRKVLYIAKQLSIIKTIYFNFVYFPFGEAIRFPVLIARHTILRNLGGTVRISSPKKTGIVKIGFVYVGIYDFKSVKSLWEVSKGSAVCFRGNTYLGSGIKISVCGGVLEFGNNSAITANSSIICKKKIVIGDNSLLSWNVLIMDTDFHKIYDNNSCVNPDKRVEIQPHVWIGCNCLILKGAFIPEGCVIGANTVVNKMLAEKFALYAGRPASIKKTNISWEK